MGIRYLTPVPYDIMTSRGNIAGYVSIAEETKGCLWWKKKRLVHIARVRIAYDCMNAAGFIDTLYGWKDVAVCISGEEARVRLDQAINPYIVTN